MQIVRLNCAFSRNLGRGDDVDGLGAIMRGILKKVDVLISIAEHAEIPNDIRQACIALLIERAAVFA